MHEFGKTLVELRNVSVAGGPTIILSDITWALAAGANWAVLGGNGAGKTTFLKLIRGDIWPVPNCGARSFHTNGTVRESPIGFREKTGIVSPELLDTYKQNGWNIKGREVVLTGFLDSAYLTQEPNGEQILRAEEVMQDLGIMDLAARDFLTLSLGQAKKVLIARAIVHRPQLLILDELCAGLDAKSKKIAVAIIQTLADNGTQILCSTHVEEDLPSAVTHILKLDSGKIVGKGPRTGTIGTAKPAHVMPDIRLNSQSPAVNGEPLITIKDTDVFLKGKRALRNINWTINTGENWVVFGPNGSGKTTLLRLIAGDLAPAWGGAISRFGSGDSHNLWKLRRRISLVSADIQAWHEYSQTGLEVVISGFFGSIGVHDPVSEAQEQIARQWLLDYDLTHLVDRDVQTLSYGQLRILLIMRAMVTNPKILLLDEPLSGLDKNARPQILNLVDSLASKGTTLVYVTHRIDELPSAITKALVLEEGRVSFCGKIEAAVKNRF